MPEIDPQPGYAPLDAKTGEEVKLSMQRLWLTGRVLAAGARLMVEHVFEPAGSKPVEVVYAFVLPRDAALRRFTIRGKGFTAHSELRTVAEATRLYEKGIAQGSLATLARQYRDGVINLTVGNIRPGETVTVRLEILAGVESRDDGFRFRFPFTLAPGYHPKAKVLETEPGAGEIELPENEFEDMMLPKFKQDASNLHAAGFGLRLLAAGGFAEIGSPSHAIRVISGDDGGLAEVLLARGKDLPNRDLVLDARSKTVAPETIGGRSRDGKLHFVGIIPSSSFGEAPASGRRIVFLLDRSGSMQGAPVEQAKRAVSACLGALAPEDHFNIIAFDDRLESFRPEPVPATAAHREAAREFLRFIDARGGTELAAAVNAAASAGAGDVMVMTDGQVMGTEQILSVVRAAGIRLHCLGIGSASQDRFLTLLARETGGVSRFVTPRERVDLSAVDLFASVGQPVATDVKVSGALVEPDPPAAVFRSTPFVFYGECGNTCEPRIQWGERSLSLPVNDMGSQTGETMRLLRGSRLITEIECRNPADTRLEELSRSYGLANRRMALVVVVVREGDIAGEAPKTEIVPVGMPEDTSFHAYFQAPAAAPAAAFKASFARAIRFDAGDVALFDRSLRAAPARRPADEGIDILLELAGRMEGDGGMRGESMEERILRTLVCLLAFLEQGHSTTTGAFRMHVNRLVGFLESGVASLLPEPRRAIVNRAVERVRSGNIVPGAWGEKARKDEAEWKDLERLA
jgi:Ca-activated chloride channel family protein